jgi:hypothetical protein
MAPAIINTLLGRSVEDAALGPLEVGKVLFARDDSKNTEFHDPSEGIIRPQDINNNAVFAIFGIIGAAFVLVGIWFFFWAKNGGFYFKKTDWDDYTSTVLRRKGPNGTIYSDATPSTILGGGSVYKDVEDGTTTVTGDDATTVVSGTTGITGGVSDISGRERRRKRREQKEREKERRREERAREKDEKRSRGIVIDEEAAAQAEEELREYRHEKPARVGGINSEAEGSTWDGSTNPTWSTMSPSTHGTEETGSTVTDDLLSHRQRTPTTTPTKNKDANAGRIRKVYSTAEKRDAREAERLRAEARRLAEKGRAAVRQNKNGSSSNNPEMSEVSSGAVALRRDFSFVRGAEERVALRRIDELPAPAESVVSEGTEVTATTSSTADNERNRARESRRHSRSRSRHYSHHQSRHSREVPSSWTESEVGTSVVSGSTEDEVGTKVYTHPHHIPTGAESSIAPDDSISNYVENKRNRRASRRERERDRERARA